MRKNGLEALRNGSNLSTRELLNLIITLSIPAILAQVSSIIMQYIDASMVGHLGSNQSASIGLISSSTWLLGSLCSAISIGFTVQIAHAIGAKEEQKARHIVKVGLLTALLCSGFLALLGVSIHKILPGILGGDPVLYKDASLYFLVFSLSMPAIQLNHIGCGMVQCSGNMKIPSLLQTMMCFLDVIFNGLLIFPGKTYTPALLFKEGSTFYRLLEGTTLYLPGAGLGVTGAALGTALAELLTAGMILYYLLFRCKALRLQKEGKKTGVPPWNTGQILQKALHLAIPVGIEQVVTCSAYVVSTHIVSPLGTIAIAAHSFSVTTESLCYMPGYGIAHAATTLIGQSIGAKRKDLTEKLAYLTTGFGMVIMTLSAVLMYIYAPYMIGLLTPDTAIRTLGTTILRIEAFAEPMYAASIVASGVFRGAGDTLVPSCLNFCSMWLIRLPLSAILAKSMNLKGVWIAMCVELCARGSMFLIRLFSKKWLKKEL